MQTRWVWVYTSELYMTELYLNQDLFYWSSQKICLVSNYYSLWTISGEKTFNICLILPPPVKWKQEPSPNLSKTSSPTSTSGHYPPIQSPQSTNPNSSESPPSSTNNKTPLSPNSTPTSTAASSNSPTNSSSKSATSSLSHGNPSTDSSSSPKPSPSSTTPPPPSTKC